MACKFHASMNQTLSSCPLVAPRAGLRHAAHIALAIALVVTAGAVHAEKADRLKPMNIVADRGGKLDQQNRVAEVGGNVVITKGTIVMRADRVQASQSVAGYDNAVAFGSAGRPATFRQKRDGAADEFIE